MNDARGPRLRFESVRKTSLTLVGVAGFEPAASSSRSQVHRSASRSCPGTGLPRLSVGVRGSPPTNLVIVTQLVTRAVLPAGRRRLGKPLKAPAEPVVQELGNLLFRSYSTYALLQGLGRSERPWTYTDVPVRL